MITVTANVQPTRACNGCGAATYRRYGQPPQLRPADLSDITIKETITTLCPTCLAALAACIATRQHESQCQ